MRRIVSIVLSLSLIISFSIPAYAQESINPEEEITKIREEVELREPNADTYLLSDGSYECVVYSDNKYYENDNGELVEIDNSIVNTEMTIGEESYAYANKANSTKVYFSDSKPAIYLDSIGKNLSFEMIDTLNTNAVVGGDKTAAPISDFKLSGDNYILYPEIEHQTDLVYEVRNGLLKEYIIIKESGAPTEYSFRFNSNYRLEKTEGGVVIVYDNKGEAVFELGRLFAVDAADNYTEDLEYTITEESGECIVTVSVSPDYMNAPEREFPVLVDPSIPISGELDTFDSYVSSKNASTNYYTSTYLKTGKSNNFYKRRSYIKFSIPTTISSGRVTSAYIRIKKRGGVEPSVKVYQVKNSWAPSTITWDNKPGYYSGVSRSLNADSDNWYKATVTTYVKKWVYGDASNYGMLLKDDIETNTDHYTEFYSSDAASPNKPELHITYTVKKAARLLTVIPNSTMPDQSLWMPTAKNNLLQCDLSSVFTRADSFDFTEIQNYLDDGGNSVFISQSHGNYENDAAGNQALTYITINETQLMNFYSTDYYFGDLNLSNMKLVIYTGCYTGRGGPNGKNLPNKTVSRGAATSVGFKHLVDGAYTNNWLKAFSGLMKNGETVSQACEDLIGSYLGTGLDNYTLAGNQNTKLKN